MSSPLSWFRKNQKFLLGFFGVALMFVFTISLGSGVDPIIDRLSGRTSGGPSDNAVVTWDGGQLGENQLGELRRRRILLRRFVTGVMRTARERGGQQQVLMLPMFTGDQSLLELELLAREADVMGIEVRDEAVLGYLNQLSGGTIQPAEYGQLLKEHTGNNLSENALFALLAREIKAHKVRGLVQSGSFPASPVAGWDYYNRLNRLIKAEIMPIMVDDYLDKVGEPSDAEVEALFEKYKNQYAHPLSPEPGFRQRERRAFQYVKLDYNAFLEEEKAAVTDEEVQKYYNENKQQYRTTSEDDLQLDLNLDDADASESSNSTTDEALEDADRETTSTEESAGGSDDSAADETDPESTGDNVSETPDPPTATPGEDRASSDETAAEVDGEFSEEPSTVPRSETPAPSPTALPQGEDVEIADTSAAPEPEDTEPEDTSSDVPDEATSTGDESSSDNDGDVEEANSTDAENSEVVTTADENNSDDAPAEQPNKFESSSDETAADGIDQAPGDESDEELDISDLDDISTYRALSEVEDEIRQSLAAPRAQTRMRDAVDTVRREMDIYFKDFTLWEMDLETNPDLSKPPLPDFSVIIGDKYATIGTIELTDRIDIENYEIGQALDFVITPQSGVQRVFFADVAYDPSSQLYQPFVFPNLEMAPERFVFWMTDHEAEYIPTLEQIRNKVVEAWQRQQALEIAKVDAERLVVKARRAKTRLEECLADEKHTTFADTGEVSWVTLPLQEGANPRISPISGAEDAGEELRRTLFRLPPGGVAYATNLPKTKVYVFRVENETPSPEVRREQFLQFGTSGAVQALANQDSRNSLSQWYRDLNERYNVDWQRDPHRGDDGGF